MRCLVLLILICLTLCSCQSTSMANRSPTTKASITTPVDKPGPTIKPEDQADQILNAAMEKNYIEAARLLDSVHSIAALNSLFFQVILERIKYNIDLDVAPVIQMFIDRHADVNATDPNSKQTLITTSASTVGDFVKPLVLAGADVNRTDAYNGTPLAYVSSRRNPALVRFLLEHGARLDVGNRPLLAALRPFGHAEFHEENVEIVKMLIKAGANVNDKDDQGSTPLAIAAMYNQQEVVQYLIDHGAQVNVQNINGRTPLMEAVAAVEGAKSEDAVLEVVKIMLKADANPHAAPDKYGNTAISLANKLPKVAEEIQKAQSAHK